MLALSYGVRTPEFHIVRRIDEIDECEIGFPAIPKLCYEGSSKGLRADSVAYDRGELKRMVNYLIRVYKQPVLIEKFIEGREIDVPIIGTSPTKAFGVVGITLKGRLDLGKSFLTSRIIRDDAYGFVYPLDEPFVAEAEKSALMTYNLLDCKDFGRVDMRIDDEGRPYLLELNPYPFLGKHSSFNEISEKSGIGYKGMIGMILESALRRQEIRRHA